MAPQSVARGVPRSGDRAASGMPERAKVYMGRQQPAGVASSSGRNCSALRGLARFYRNPYGTGICGWSALSGSWRRGLTIRVVAFRASHPAKPPSRQRRFIQRFPNASSIFAAVRISSMIGSGSPPRPRCSAYHSCMSAAASCSRVSRNSSMSIPLAAQTSSISDQSNSIFPSVEEFCTHSSKEKWWSSGKGVFISSDIDYLQVCSSH